MTDQTRESLIAFVELVKEICHNQESIRGVQAFDETPDKVCDKLVDSLLKDPTIAD